MSASSKTIIYKFYIPMLLEFINRSKIRPGVPITNSGLFLRDDYCFWIELAPIAKVAYKFVNLLSFPNYSKIWMANSLVGVTIRPRMYPTAATL